jgi:hypothetical protein
MFGFASNAAWRPETLVIGMLWAGMRTIFVLVRITRRGTWTTFSPPGRRMILPFTLWVTTRVFVR